LGTSGAGAGGGVTSAAALTSFVCAPANAVVSTINPIGNSRILFIAIFSSSTQAFDLAPTGTRDDVSLPLSKTPDQARPSGRLPS
jgi:hypothetical protein